MADEKYVFSERWPEDFKAIVRAAIAKQRRAAAESFALLKRTDTDFYRAHVEVLRLCDVATAALDEAFASPSVVSGRSND